MKYCFIFPHAGALRSDYKNFEKSLEGHCKCLYYSREEFMSSDWRTNIQSSFEFIKSHLANTNEDYIIIGHSMGAMQAFFTASMLESSNMRKPSRVILSSMYPPNITNIRDLEILVSLDINKFTDEIIKLGGIPKQILERKDLLGFFINRIKEDISKMKDLKASEEKLESRVICLAGADDKKYSFLKMNEWSSFANHPLETKVFNGGHFYIINIYQEVADYIKTILAKE